MQEIRELGRVGDDGPLRQEFLALAAEIPVRIVVDLLESEAR